MTPTLEEIREAAKFLPDANNLPKKEVIDAFGKTHIVDEGNRIVIDVNGKRIQFDICTESGKGSRKFWFYYGAVEVAL